MLQIVFKEKTWYNLKQIYRYRINENLNCHRDNILPCKQKHSQRSNFVSSVCTMRKFAKIYSDHFPQKIREIVVFIGTKIECKLTSRIFFFWKLRYIIHSVEIAEILSHISLSKMS